MMNELFPTNFNRLPMLQFTGLSGAGKTTLAQALQERLLAEGIEMALVDGDQYRKALNRDLGFSAEDRKENIRRLGKVAAKFREEGKLPVIAAINPFEEIRQELKEKYGALTVWIHCSLPLLMERDTKGLYRRALLPDDDPDKIHNLTGVNDLYEPPADADLMIDTGIHSPGFCTESIYQFLQPQLR